MKFKRRLSVLIIMFCIIMGSMTIHSRRFDIQAAQGDAKIIPSENSESTEVKTIRALLDQQMNDWNQGNLTGFLNAYWRSPKVVFQSGDVRFDGWDQVQERYLKRYGKNSKTMGKLRFESLEIELLGKNDAFARGRFRLETSDGKNPTGLFTLILRKFPEGWKIIHDHTSTKSG